MQFTPVIGSSFDAVADQQKGWAGFNANVQRQNLDSFAQANAARNNYFQTVAEMQRADAERQQQEDAKAQADAVQQYQFNVNAQLDKSQQDIESQKIKAQTAAKDYADSRKQALSDAKDNEVAADALATAGHFNSPDEIDKALPNSTPLVKAALWQKNADARQQIGQQYNFAGDIAKKENLKTGLTDMAAKLPASKDVQPANPPPSFLGEPLTWAADKLINTPPDTSWYDQRKAAMTGEAAGLGRDLAPFEKQGLDANDIVLDPATGKYKPASTPAWLQNAQPTAQPPTAAAPARKPLDRATALAYLNAAKGDKNKARQLALADGYSF